MRIEFLSSFSATSAQSLPRYLPGTHRRGGRLSEILQIDGKDGDGTRGKGASHRPFFFFFLEGTLIKSYPIVPTRLAEV